MKKELVRIPTKCPSCESTLDRVKDQLFCRNDECSSTVQKKILHFCKTMKIKGMGEKTLEKLELNSIVEIYELTIEELTSVVGEKVGTKLFNEIEKSKSTDMETYLPSFSISLIGKSVASKLSGLVANLGDITSRKCSEAGLGQKATDNLLDWIDTEYPKYKNLPVTIVTTTKPKQVEATLKVCITGKLNDFPSRTKAANELETLGVKVVSTVSKTLDFVIDDSNSESSKIKKARDYGIPVVTYNTLIEEINKL